MQTKPLLFGIIGFILGGLIVSIAAVTIEKPKGNSMTMQDMTSSLQGKTGDDFDKVFIEGMIEHHQGAIDMANLAKTKAKHQEIKSMADDIISAQSKEIDLMQSWQTDWGYKTVPTSHPTGH